MASLTHALILTAGLGTRLEPLTKVRAKPAFPVGDQPLIRRIIAHLANHDVIDVTLNLHHLPHTLTSIVGDGRDLGVRVRYSWEGPQILGSAGGPRQALDIIGADSFLVINGDTISDVDLGRLADVHHRTQALVTLALVPNTRFMHYGGVLLSDSGAVTGFVRRGPSAAGSFHFFGSQLVNRRVFAELRAGVPAQSIGDVYDRLIAEHPGSVQGFACDARYWDIGTVNDYWKTSRSFQAGAANTTGQNVRINGSASVQRSILWDDIDVGDRAVIDECIVTDGVRIEPGTMYRRSILMRGDDGQLIATPFEAE